MKNKVKEIGSEFDFSNDFSTDNSNGLFENGLLTFSGRGAIYEALSDILKAKKIDTAWLPSYSCESMAQPFYDLGINVGFYSVNYDFGKKEIVRGDFEMGENDVVLTMSYFGFCDKGNEEIISKCRSNGVKVIEDCTHSLLSDDSFVADYRVCSLRKWFPVASGGFVQKKEGVLDARLNACDNSIVDVRISAMKEKTLYLENGGDESAKSAFLDKYKAVNKSFSENYKNLAIDSFSRDVVTYIDVDAIRERRRENAMALLCGLEHIPIVSPLFTNLEKTDCPLFVPILSENRSALQKSLAKNSIYCPAHWPRYSDKADSNLYDLELSLICDQRYGKKDMERIISILSKEF